MSKQIIVEVSLWIDDESDAYDVIADCDYSFSHDAIKDTEIIGVINENSQAVYLQ